MRLNATYPTIRSIGAYRPKRLGLHDDFSRLVLDFKDGDPYAQSYFEGRLRNHIPHNHTLVIVPGHDPRSPEGPMHALVRRICRGNASLRDATTCLRRVAFHQKLSHGGSRSIESHLRTIQVFEGFKIYSQRVILIDDVSTTGNSIEACRQLLLKAGAASVEGLTLAQTTHKP